MEQIEQLDQAIRTLVRVLIIDERRAMSGLEDAPFNPIDLEILAYLQRLPGAPAKDIASFLSVRTTTMQSAVDRLQKRGLIHRDALALKGRAVALSLTDAGSAFFQQIHQQNLANCRQMLASITQSEHARFIKNMSEIASSFSNE